MKIIRCCKLNFMQWRIQPKYALCAAFLILQMWYMFRGLGDYTKALGFSLHPWIFALLPADYLHFATLLLPFVLIISDAPFRSRQQQFVLQRTGKMTWICGQLLYLFVTCVLYTFIIWILSWLFLLPYTEWGSDWGVAIGTATQTDAHRAYSDIILEYYVIKGATPLEATAWVAFTMVAVLFLLGEIMILCNLWTAKGVGTAIVSAFVFISLFLSYLKGFLPREWLWFSPVSWMDRSVMGYTRLKLPSYGYAAGMLIGLSILLGAVLLLTIHRCNLDTEKE